MKTTYYAIGDVHGENEALWHLLEEIYADIDSLGVQNPVIVFVGDYVDRGPDSRSVVDTIRTMQVKGEAGDVKIIALKGNHEDQLVWCYNNRYEPQHKDNVDNWMQNYGNSAIRSWGISDVADLPQDDVEWMENLPLIHADPENKIVFVHAGFDPASFPDKITDREVLWSRNFNFFQDISWNNPALEGWLVVHGHTPLNMPHVSPRRINVDTGACFGNALTCARFDSEDRKVFLIDYDLELKLIRRRQTGLFGV